VSLYTVSERGFLLSLDTLLLEDNASNYDYLNKSRREVDGIDDLEEWSLLKASENFAKEMSI
jgi:myosin protein heavy chain